MATFKNIVVPTDYGAAAERATEIACELAKQFRARLTLLHIWEVPLPAYSERITLPLEEMQAAARDAMEAEVRRVRAFFPDVASLVIPGLAWRGIEEAVKEHRFDLIVIGTHGRRGVDRLLMGSVAEKIVRVATVPVLTVHAPESDA
jgi:nucleotide-binding universal stress UspA family protein